ncbi:MAG: hypothetical protein ACI8RZ_005243 [Myxococcota bacterium]|jgi:hypothetical protein
MPEVAITLKIVGAGEDYPRLLTGYRSFRGGVQVALAMRPTDRQTLLSVSQKDGSAVLYDSVQEHHRAQMDAPIWPTTATTAKEVEKHLKAAQRNLPKAGPIIMRGQWRAKLYVDVEAKTARLVLVRKIASYGTLTIAGQGEQWTWRFERAAKWFAGDKSTGSASGVSYKTLTHTIQRAYAKALDLVGEACGTKDTRRRQALDPEYAAKRPTRVPKVRASEPLDRFKLPKPKRGKTPRKKAGSCDTCATDSKPMKTGGRAVPVATTPAALSKQAVALKADAEALASTAVPKVAMSVDAVLNHFINRGGIEGFNDLWERISDYSRGQLPPLDRTVPLDDFIAQLRTDAKKARDSEWKLNGDSNNVAASYAAEDEAAITALEMALRSAPTQLARTRSLILYAQAAASSPKCRGPEQADALSAIARAEASYEEARKALVKGGEKQALTAIRQSAAWIALSASKIGASCKAGQKGLLGRMPTKAAPPKGTPPKAAPKGDAQLAPGDVLKAKADTFLSTPSAATAKAWMKLALSQRGMTASKLSARRGASGVGVTVSGFTDADIEDTKAIDWLLPNGLTVKWAGTTAKKAPKKTPKPRTKKAAAAPEMSATDAILMKAFQGAIAAAVGASA